MKIIFFSLVIIMIIHVSSVLGNNVQVSNVRLTGQDTVNNFTLVEFDISWENSWRYSGGPANWDAVWIFIKYRIGSGGTWKHAWLNDTGHTICAMGSVSNGFLYPEQPYHSSNNPSLGVFLYRSGPGSGDFSCQNIQLRWNYGSNSVPDQAQVDINVFAVEMVYIPQGSFYVGSGGSESGAFYKYPNSNTPFLINSEAAINIGAVTDYLYYTNPSGVSGDQSGPVPAAFPKGYNAFYAMKYEISQQCYVDFLNTLTRPQQITRVESDISGTTVTKRWVMIDLEFTAFRSYISCRTTIPAQPAPVEFYADQYPDNVEDENVGNNVACGFLSFNDVAAYLDWAGLRLLTELEFEKCGRGNATALANEFAWGNNIYHSHSGILNLGTPNETPNDPFSNIVSDYSNGPLRVGCFARVNSHRTTSGSGFYGCMELSSNLAERGVSLGNPEGRSYDGKHGNGILDAAGNHNVANWPEMYTTIGSFFRGGSWYNTVDDARISDRRIASWVDTGRHRHYGGRGARTAQ